MKTMIVLFAVAGLPAVHAGTNSVEKSGGVGIYTTIGAAIAASATGDTIKIGPGLFNENVRIPWELTLIGAGPQYTTVRSSTSEAAIQAEPGPGGKNLSVYALTISNPIGDGVNNLGANLRIENCVIANCGRYGIYYLPPATSQAVIRQCTIVSNFSYAIYNPANNGAQSTGFEGTIFYKNNEGGSQQDLAATGQRTASGCLIVGKPIINLTLVNSFSAPDADFMNAALGNYILKPSSPAINSGRNAAGFLDPDGSVPDIGAYGGPGAAAFWPYPTNGPVITSLQVTPAVQQGGKVAVKATATTR